MTLSNGGQSIYHPKPVLGEKSFVPPCGGEEEKKIDGGGRDTVDLWLVIIMDIIHAPGVN